MSSSLVKNSITRVIKKNIRSDVLLVFAICGVVIASLIPPQILKNIIDGNLVPRSSNRLLFLATIYMGVLLFIGIFD
ncbi:MAG: ABC transporter ATP-binding protein, partial [Clostridiaceae bacterium]|nr:ABC transporter ATP-binding protein [Clostridiaceae bacterium]